MRAGYSFGRTRGAAAHQDHCKIVESNRNRWTSRSAIAPKKLCESVVAGVKLDAVSFLFLLEQRVGEPKLERQILLDVGRDDTPD